MNILVIGGSGLFGRKIVIHLLQDRDISSVVSMDVNDPPEWFLKNIERHLDKFHFVRADVSELEGILNTIKTFSIDRIINMAFILTGAFELNPRLGVKTNTLGMCNIFEAARMMDISRVVFASSVAVYGLQEEYGDREVNEDDKLHPGNAYGLTKQLTEILSARYNELYGINFSALRPFLGHGHGGLFPPVIKEFSDLISLPAIGKPFSTVIDENVQHALSSVEDIAVFTKILIKAPSSPHPVYNIATKPISMGQIAEVIRGYISDARIDFRSQFQPDQPMRADLPWKVSCARAKEDFGFSVLPLEKAVLMHINDARLEAGLEPIT